MSLFQQVPVNYLLTSGAGSALTWTNAVSVSSMNVSSLGSNNLSVSTLTTSSSVTSASLAASTITVSSITANSVGYSTLSGSTINATKLNYSTIAGSTISSNSMTLSLTNVSTQNTQIYQVATSNPTTSYTVIQASHVSTGTTNNALVINPSGGNVGIGTTTPLTSFHILNSTSNPVSPPDSGETTGHILLRNTKTGASPYSMTIGVDQTTGAGYINAAGNGAIQPVCLQTRGGNVGIGTTSPGDTLTVNGTFSVNSTVTMSITNRLFLYWVASTNNAGFTTAADGSLNIFTGVAGVANRLTIQNNGFVNINNLTTNGTVITTGGIGQLAVSSDRRIKENIVYQSDTQQGLASVLNLKPATYRLIGQTDTYLGFIAQDVEQDIPLAVDGKKYEWQWETTEDGKPKFDANGDIVYKLDADGNRIVRPRGVSDRAIIATQTLAIQELSKKLDATQQQLAAKSAALDSLIAWAQTQGYSASS